MMLIRKLVKKPPVLPDAFFSTVIVPEIMRGDHILIMPVHYHAVPFLKDTIDYWDRIPADVRPYLSRPSILSNQQTVTLLWPRLIICCVHCVQYT